MINTQELQDPKAAKRSKLQKNKKKRYHVDTANNFICYERFKLLVSEPSNYIIVHVFIILGMVYFYVLTFCVALIVYEINYFVFALHAIATCLLIILGFKNPGIVLKITEDFDNPSKIELPFDKDCKPAVNQQAKSYALPIKSHLIGLKFCPQCLIFKPPRTVHCWVCNACIANMDHHCPFIGNCVGKGNYQIFFAFVCTLTIKMLLMITQSIVMLVRLFERYQGKTFEKPQMYFGFILLLCFVGSLMGFHFYLILNSLTTNELCKNTWDTNSGNPFRKNFCIKNIFKFIRGPADQSVPHSQQHLLKTVVAREKNKIEQYMSEYSSETYVKNYQILNTASNFRSQGPSKPQIPIDQMMSHTGQNIITGKPQDTQI